MAVYDFFDWYLDVIILTNQSIVHTEWNWFFHNTSSRMPYHSIESVSYEHSWFLSSIFRFGDLVIEREWGELVFNNTANPKLAELKILEVQNSLEWQKEVDMDSLKSLLSELVAEHISENRGNLRKNKRGFRK